MNEHLHAKINSLKNKQDFFNLAWSLAKSGELDDAKEVLQSLIAKFGHAPYAARILKNLNEQSSTIHNCRFTLDNPALSPFMRYALAQGTYEKTEYELLSTHLKGNDRVLELGAGIGFMGCQALKLQPNLPLYVGIEANPHLLELIKENMRTNNADFEVIHGVADNSSSGTVPFRIHKNFWASSIGHSTHPDFSNISVPKHDINLIIKEKEADFLIMDIEGGELDLISKIDLSKINKVIIELHPHSIGDQGVSEVIKLLIESGLNLIISSIRGHVFYFQR